MEASANLLFHRYYANEHTYYSLAFPAQGNSEILCVKAFAWSLSKQKAKYGL